jgi:hypothetical protein
MSPHGGAQGPEEYERIGVIQVHVAKEFSFEESDWFLQAGLEDIIIC